MGGGDTHSRKETKFHQAGGKFSREIYTIKDGCLAFTKIGQPAHRSRGCGGSGSGGATPVETQLHFNPLLSHTIGPVKRGSPSYSDSCLQVKLFGLEQFVFS
jgi:hypothetical protein